MIRSLIPAILLFTLFLTGCSEAPLPKTEDPAEIEKIQKKHIEDSHRERSTSK